MSAVTRAKAQQVLDAVVKRYPAWSDPALAAPPTLADPGEQCAGWAVVWEEGPPDWPHQVTMGGSTEWDHEVARQAASDFGTIPAEVPEPEPVTMPAGVYVEPVNHVALGVYPA